MNDKLVKLYTAADPDATSFPDDSVMEAWAVDELERLYKQVDDLQSGMYINCVYCGHRYGPKENTPDSMADILKQHIEQCPQHPLSAAKKEIAKLKEHIQQIQAHLPSGDQKHV